MCVTCRDDVGSLREPHTFLRHTDPGISGGSGWGPVFSPHLQSPPVPGHFITLLWSEVPDPRREGYSFRTTEPDRDSGYRSPLDLSVETERHRGSRLPLESHLRSSRLTLPAIRTFLLWETNDGSVPPHVRVGVPVSSTVTTFMEEVPLVDSSSTFLLTRRFGKRVTEGSGVHPPLPESVLFYHSRTTFRSFFGWVQVPLSIVY